MSTRRVFFLMCGGVLTAASLLEAAPLGTGFTYQGQLKQNGQPMNGTVSMVATLWDSAGSGTPPVGGNQIGVQLLANVPVANGLFTVTLNGNGQFGASAFNGDARWLSFKICPDPSDPGCSATAVFLSPRQPITAAPYANQTRGMFVDEAGFVGIGTTTPAAKLDIARIGAGLELLRFSTERPWAFRQTLSGPSTGLELFSTGGAKTFQINSNTGANVATFLADAGNSKVGIGTPSPSARLDIDDGLGWGGYVVRLTGGNISGVRSTSGFFKDGAGNLCIQNKTTVNAHAELHDNGTWTASSDRRLKREIEPLDGTLDKALALRPVSFQLKQRDHEGESRRHIGFIAQDVEPLFPELVYGDGEQMRSLDYSSVSVVAIGAVQEQQKIINAQKKTIEDLSARLKRLEKVVDRLSSEAGK